MQRPSWRYFPLVGLMVAIVDFLFATVQAEFFYKTGSQRLWQGVASVLLGKSALEGGPRTMAIGLAMHVAVAFTWSFIFFVLARNWELLRRANVLAEAAIYGPLIWIVMSIVVIPLFTHRPPNITLRWWIQLVGHIFFVGLPIVATTRWAARESASE